jgi:hypothetical protein
VRTKIGIVYEITTGRPRRIIVPEYHPGISEDQQLAAHAHVGHDEKLIIEQYSGPIDLESIKAIIQLRTGMMR